MNLPSNKIVIPFFVLIYIAGISFLLFSSKGFLRLNEVRNEVNRLNFSVDSLKHENDTLKLAIDSLRSEDRFKINRTAREKLGMHHSNERVIEVEEIK